MKWTATGEKKAALLLHSGNKEQIRMLSVKTERKETKHKEWKQKATYVTWRKRSAWETSESSSISWVHRFPCFHFNYWFVHTLLASSGHNGRDAFKHCTARQQPFADLLHERSLNTLQKLSTAVAKGQLLTRGVKGRSIVNKVRRLRAQLAKGGHGERNEVEVCILQQRRVFRYLLPFLGTQRGPSQRLINTQMRREWVRNGDVNSNRLVVSPSCDEDVSGTLLAAHADVVLNGEASSLQEMRQLADNGFMPCCEFRFITTQNMVASRGIM